MIRLRLSVLLAILQFLYLSDAVPLYGQQTKNASYIEIGSNIGVTSGTVSIERHLYSNKKEKLHLYARLGFGYLHTFYFSPSGPGSKLGISLLSGKRKHYFETELGLMGGRHIQLNEDRDYLGPMFSLGYRYQPPRTGFLFKAFAGILGVGIGVGYTWSKVKNRS